MKKKSGWMGWLVGWRRLREGVRERVIIIIIRRKK